jgi:hypothetical protein
MRRSVLFLSLGITIAFDGCGGSSNSGGTGGFWRQLQRRRGRRTVLDEGCGIRLEPQRRVHGDLDSITLFRSTMPSTNMLITEVTVYEKAQSSKRAPGFASGGGGRSGAGPP